MGNLWISGIEKEIDRCSKLYTGFSEGAGIIKETFDILESFYKSYDGDGLKFNIILPEPDQSAEMMRNNEGLTIRPDLNSELVCSLLFAVSKAILKRDSSLKLMLSDVERVIEDFRNENDARIDFEKIWELKDSLNKETGLAKDMTTFLFSIVLSSIYRRQLKTLIEVVRTDLWEGGECPVCGEKPHFGTLRFSDGAKQLECWLCGTTWLHIRIKCPFCSNEDQKQLGYFTLEDSEICRVSFCNHCCQYYKIFDARKFGGDGEITLTIHNLATLDYDLLAKKEGFNPGSGLEWINESEIVDRQD